MFTVHEYLHPYFFINTIWRICATVTILSSESFLTFTPWLTYRISAHTLPLWRAYVEMAVQEYTIMSHDHSTSTVICTTCALMLTRITLVITLRVDTITSYDIVVHHSTLLCTLTSHLHSLHTQLPWGLLHSEPLATLVHHTSLFVKS